MFLLPNMPVYSSLSETLRSIQWYLEKLHNITKNSIAENLEQEIMSNIDKLQLDLEEVIQKNSRTIEEELDTLLMQIRISWSIDSHHVITWDKNEPLEFETIKLIEKIHENYLKFNDMKQTVYSDLKNEETKIDLMSKDSSGEIISSDIINSKMFEYLNNNRYEDALYYLRALEPKDVVDYTFVIFQQGLVYSVLGKQDKAIERFENIPEGHEKYLESMFSKGMCYALLGNHKKSIECYEQIPEGHEKYYESVLALGVSYGKLNNLKKSIQYLDKIPKTHEHYPPAMYYKALFQKDS